MKQIVNGHVFDLGYGGYDRVCQLVPRIVKNTIGKDVALEYELRKDRMNGLYYVFATYESGYSCDPRRNLIEIVPVEQAMAIASEYLQYSDFKQYFPDPEGADAELKRRADEAEKKAESAANDKQYWYNEHCKLQKKLDETKAADEAKDGTIAQLKSEIEALKEKIFSLLTPDGRG